ncbi:putative MFS multidrug transporter [Xylona heveae TC161]|uniref:Putative MFS multidrug transporter n=1 Tax=Xylona heveae (strain CBS 132557 / TC161) TaxID=1328760 RepID=A0A165FHD4_XYLHT|nr:putative MFS multidrug transporter [Xylona heveae TC161]KZF20982.1 putative MFS multidrug transporter [Xylona heveae TC161]
MGNSEDQSRVPATGRPSQLDNSNIGSLRLSLSVIGLWICLFLSAMETTIVATALRRISDDLKSQGQSTWIVVAYLLTYNGFLLVYSKLTDIFGQKSLLLLAQFIFLVFSMACGGAQTMTQLIVFRALQGIGGSGIYSTVFVIITKIATVEKIGLYTGILSSVFALASLLGPILGGVIVDNTTWRWVFFINGPGVVLSLLFVVPAIPSLGEKLFEKEKLRRVDALGGLLSLAWSTMLVFALEEAGGSYAWGSSTIIGTLVGSGVALIAFVLYETWVQRRSRQEPMLPIRLLKSPTLSLNLITMFAMGGCFYAAIILLPQRFQSVNGLSAARAGIDMLAFTLVSPAFSMLCGFLLSKIPKIATLLLIFGSALTLVGLGLLSSLSTAESIAPATYGYEVILALGLGFMMPPLIFLLKVEYDDADLAVAIGANNTARTLGGCVGLAVCSTVLHADLGRFLRAFLNPSQIAAVLSASASISELSKSEASRVRQAYGESYGTQFRVLIAFAGLSFIGSLGLGIMWRRRGLQVRTVQEETS